MRIRRVIIERFRGIKHLQFHPGPRTVILGPNNSGKSSVLEALDLLLHPGLGRPRPAPEEMDYFGRNPEGEFQIEAVLGDLPKPFRAEVHQHLEGWKTADNQVVAEPDGPGVEPVVRVRVRGTTDLEVLHEFAKPESEGARFHPKLRAYVGWVFDGRVRDPGRDLSFYQGGLLERLFSGMDLDPAVEALRGALGAGAGAVNQDGTVEQVLHVLSEDLEKLGMLRTGESAAFEAGAASRRTLLQALRLTLPAGEVPIPLGRQGRGAQRLVLVAIVLRLAAATGILPIGGFEEPEEALEPLRQTQLAEMLLGLADGGGQVFLVTHSSDIVRVFGIDDLLLLQERTAGQGACHLRHALAPAIRQAYERWLDGPLVRGVFCRIPILGEGSSGRAAFQVFWRDLAKAGDVLPAYRLGLDVVNCESVSNMPMLASVLHGAGKTVVAWADQDTADALREVARLKAEKHCAGLVLHDPTPGRQNLEQALAWGCSLAAAAEAMQAIAADRGYSWEDQRSDLLSRCEGMASAVRERAKVSESVATFFSVLEEHQARHLAAVALGAKGVAPFEMKGARQARLMAETIVRKEGVPANFARAFRQLDKWIREGCASGVEIQIKCDA